MVDNSPLPQDQVTSQKVNSLLTQNRAFSEEESET